MIAACAAQRAQGLSSRIRPSLAGGDTGPTPGRGRAGRARGGRVTGTLPGDEAAGATSGAGWAPGRADGLPPVMRARRSRLAFVTTDSEEAAMAAAAIIGDSTIPVNGYSSPAAMGMPAML